MERPGDGREAGRPGSAEQRTRDEYAHLVAGRTAAHEFDEALEELRAVEVDRADERRCPHVRSSAIAFRQAHRLLGVRRSGVPAAEEEIEEGFLVLGHLLVPHDGPEVGPVVFRGPPVSAIPHQRRQVDGEQGGSAVIGVGPFDAVAPAFSEIASD